MSGVCDDEQIAAAYTQEELNELWTLRDALPAHVPLLVAGGIHDVATAEAAEAAGADVLVLCRTNIAQPEWPLRYRQPDFTRLVPPWAPDVLRAADVGEALLTYLHRFPGLVVGGAPPR